MITAVDTNVLLDVFAADTTFGEASAAAVRRCSAEGSLVASEVVWAEVASVFPRAEAAARALAQLGVEFSSVEDRAALRAGSAWRAYREGGGRRGRPVADFLIGAHADLQADRLLTRDRGFYRGYFGSLKVLDPTQR